MRVLHRIPCSALTSNSPAGTKPFVNRSGQTGETKQRSLPLLCHGTLPIHVCLPRPVVIPRLGNMGPRSATRKRPAAIGQRQAPPGSAPGRDSPSRRGEASEQGPGLRVHLQRAHGRLAKKRRLGIVSDPLKVAFGRVKKKKKKTVIRPMLNICIRSWQATSSR